MSRVDPFFSVEGHAVSPLAVNDFSEWTGWDRRADEDLQHIFRTWPLVHVPYRGLSDVIFSEPVNIRENTRLFDHTEGNAAYHMSCRRIWNDFLRDVFRSFVVFGRAHCTWRPDTIHGSVPVCVDPISVSWAVRSTPAGEYEWKCIEIDKLWNFLPASSTASSEQNAKHFTFAVPKEYTFRVPKQIHTFYYREKPSKGRSMSVISRLVGDFVRWRIEEASYTAALERDRNPTLVISSDVKPADDASVHVAQLTTALLPPCPRPGGGTGTGVVMSAAERTRLTQQHQLMNLALDRYNRGGDPTPVFSHLRATGGGGGGPPSGGGGSFTDRFYLEQGEHVENVQLSKAYLDMKAIETALVEKICGALGFPYSLISNGPTKKSVLVQSEAKTGSASDEKAKEASRAYAKELCRVAETMYALMHRDHFAEKLSPEFAERKLKREKESGQSKKKTQDRERDYAESETETDDEEGDGLKELTGLARERAQSERRKPRYAPSAAMVERRSHRSDGKDADFPTADYWEVRDRSRATFLFPGTVISAAFNELVAKRMISDEDFAEFMAASAGIPVDMILKTPQVSAWEQVETDQTTKKAAAEADATAKAKAKYAPPPKAKKTK